jgi:inner membrane protein
MDPLTQGLLGTSLAQSFATRPRFRVAAICGLLGGMAPDLDVFIRSKGDPLFFLEYHRHFTHSLAFVPFGGLIVSVALFAMLKKRASFKEIYLYSTLGLATHGLLDACTTYGTSLYWPFSSWRVSWNIISIIDPIFTGILLIAVILALVKRNARVIQIGLGLALLYLAFGIVQHHRVGAHMSTVAKQRGHVIEKRMVNPTLGNTFLWRSVYQHEKTYFVDAVYVGLFSPPRVKAGVRIPVIDKETVFPEIEIDTVQRQDIRRFSHFSQTFICIDPGQPNVISDLRYGSLPYDARSLWGIRVDPLTPERHTAWANLRHFSKADKIIFWEMVKGHFPDSK